MPETSTHSLLEQLLDSWDRNNAILLNLLQLLPGGGLEARVTNDSPSVAQLFAHMHFVRLVFISEDAPEFARELPQNEWASGLDTPRLRQLLRESAQAVRDAVKHKVETGGEMKMHYDHPILFLQHMIWHEGYHHGQIKLALKTAGCGISDEQAGPATWDIWMQKK